MHFGEQCVLAAVGVDLQGRKHVLALREGATENAEVLLQLGISLPERLQFNRKSSVDSAIA
jgi:putative transposase